MAQLTPRYDGKPLLKILECYVLKAIGKLPELEDGKLNMITPNLAQIYSHNGTWVEIITTIMKFPPNMPTLINEMWEKNQAVAKRENLVLTPQQFAEMFVDQNFV
jgi:hypothetical protein